MDFVIEIITEILITPIIEILYTFAMLHFSNKRKKLTKDKIRGFVVFECFVLLVLFFVGGIMLLETGGESLFGKIILISSVVVSSVPVPPQELKSINAVRARDTRHKNFLFIGFASLI